MKPSCKATIAKLVELGSTIEVGDLTDAPGFSFAPVAAKGSKPVDLGPTRRGTLECTPAWKLKSQWYRAPRHSLDPMYSTRMTGDCDALTRARSAWAAGDPKPLRAYLAKTATARAEQWLAIDAQTRGVPAKPVAKPVRKVPAKALPKVPAKAPSKPVSNIVPIRPNADIPLALPGVLGRFWSRRGQPYDLPAPKVAASSRRCLGQR